MNKAHSVTTLAPHRISLVGGGTDLPQVSKNIGGGCISMTISKYIYVTCKHHNESQFNERYRLQYSQTEVTKTRSAIQNNIIRKSLEYLEIDEPIHISISSDLPTGSGLGSSSSFTVALLYGLKTLFQMPTNQFEIAEEAFEVERLINGDAIGRQDQYAAAIGGFNYYRFNREGLSSVRPLQNSAMQLNGITKNSFLLWTGISRNSSDILRKQNDDIEKNIKYYNEMNKLTERLYNESKEDEIELTTYAKYIKENWMIKKRMSKSITTKHIEQLIESCMQRGALACKLLGAGGGGYVFVIAPNKESMKNQLLNEGHYVEDIKYDPMGSRVLSTFSL